MASFECEPLQRGDRQRHLAIPQFRNLASAARWSTSLRSVHPWNARSMVQKGIPPEACEEMDVLALGGISGAARCERGPVHLRRGAAAGTGFILVVQVPRGRRQLRYRET